MQKPLARRVLKNAQKPRTGPASARGRNRSKNRLGITMKGAQRLLRLIGIDAAHTKVLGPGIREILVAEVLAQNDFLLKKGHNRTQIRAWSPHDRKLTLRNLRYGSPFKEKPKPKRF
ncbi:MAG: hypothetical protein Q7S92_05175 [Candidatus Diapherotrites archaeon]|nr:hypothetical protein [Candidatus Diapherotrites archaeon]